MIPRNVLMEASNLHIMRRRLIKDQILVGLWFLELTLKNLSIHRLFNYQKRVDLGQDGSNITGIRCMDVPQAV